MKKCLVVICLISLALVLKTPVLVSKSYEEKLLLKLQESPDDLKSIRKLAYFYYKNSKFENTVTYFRKLQEKNSLEDKDKYHLYIAGCNLPNVSIQNWNKLHNLRNTKIVTYKSFIHDFKFKIPEHWVPINSFTKNVNYVFYNNKLVPADSLMQADESSDKKSVNEGIIYCGPNFLINYKLRNFDKYKENHNYKYDEYDKIDVINIYSMLKNSKRRIKSDNITGNAKMFAFVKNLSSGKVDKSEYNEDDLIADNPGIEMGYITYLINRNRHLIGFMVNKTTLKGFSFDTKFSDGLSDSYIKEIDTFIIEMVLRN